MATKKKSIEQIKQHAVDAVAAIQAAPGQVVVTLRRGYRVHNSETGSVDAYKTVVIKAPTMRDVVERDGLLHRLARGDEHDQGLAASETFSQLELIRRCIVSFHGLAVITVEHLMDLSRGDAILLMKTIEKIEAEVEKNDADASSSS